MADADRILRRFADRQLDLVTRKQALAAGVSDPQLRRRLRSGVLRKLHLGVYLFGGGRPTFEQRALAACLACGDDAYVSGPSAAVLWGLMDAHEGPIHVTLPITGGDGHQGIIVHRSRVDGPTERTILDKVPIARVNRVLVDIAGASKGPALEAVVDASIRLRRTTPSALLDYLEGRNAKGSGLLRKIAKDRLAHGSHDMSFEADTERVLVGGGLPQPERQVWMTINGRRFRFDLFYREERVAIEPSGEAPHWGRHRWQADHDKRIAARHAGIDMIEFTWADVHERPIYVLMTAGDALGLTPSKWVKKRPR